MASTSIPLTNVGSGYTIVTQVIPSAQTTAQTTAELNSFQALSPLQRFMKGEPKVLGALEIMNGILFLMAGIVVDTTDIQSIFVLCDFQFWGSFIYILAGSLSVSASNKFNICMVRGAMVVNILSAITAGLSAIVLSLDLLFWMENGNECESRITKVFHGVTGILLFFALFQFAISIAISVFTCKAACFNESTLNIINVVPNPVGSFPMNTSDPTQPGTSTTHTAAMGNLPDGNPPAYSDIKMDEQH